MTTLETFGATHLLQRRIGQRWEATRAPAGALQTAGRAVFTSRTVRLAPAGAGTKAINPSVFYPIEIVLTIGMYSGTLITHRFGGIIVVNHWEPATRPNRSVSLVSLSNFLDLPESIAINYRALSLRSGKIFPLIGFHEQA